MLINISKEKITQLTSINPNVPIEKINKLRRDVYVLGYYNQNKLKGYCIYISRSYDMIEVIDCGYTNKQSFLKMLLLLHNKFLHKTIIIPLDYYRNIKALEKENLFESYVHTDGTSIKLKKITNRLYLSIYCLSNSLQNINNLYFELCKNYEVKEIYNKKQTLIRQFFRINLIKLSTLNKDDKIRILSVRYKSLYNGGEKNYTKVLRKNGFIKKSNPTYFKDNFKQYSLKKEEHKVTLKIYTVIEIDTSNFKNKNTFSFYRGILNYCSRKYSHISVLNENYTPCNISDFIYPVNHTYILENHFKNGFFLEEVNNILKESNLYDNNKARLYPTQKSLLKLKRQIGKENTLDFIKFIISKNKNKDFDLNKVFSDKYETIIRSNFLTKQAILKVLFSKKTNCSMIKTYLKNFHCVWSEVNSFKCNEDLISSKELRKDISRSVKKDISLKEKYLNHIYNAMDKYIPNISYEEKEKLFELVKEFDKGNYVSYSSIVDIFKNIKDFKTKMKKEKIIMFLDKLLKEFISTKDKKNFHHNIYYMYYKQIFYNEFLTNKAIEIIVFSPFEEVVTYKKQIDKIRNFLYSFIELSAANKIKFRNSISDFVKKGLDIEEYYNELGKNVVNIYFPDITEEEKKNFSSFVVSLNKYALVKEIDFLATFGKNSLDIVNNKVNSIFQEYSIDNRCKEIGNLVGAALGNKNEKGLLSNPKKLYGDLRKIYNVSDIVSGNFPNIYCKEILDCLRTKGISIPNNILYWVKIEKKCSPEYLMAGDITNCCMDFGSRKAITYALEEGFGLISIYNNNTIVSNSLIWIQDKLNCLVLDNIECVTPVKNENILKEQYMKIISYILEKYELKFAVQGNGYNDLKLFDNKDKPVKSFEIKAQSVNIGFYTDARKVHYLNI